MIKRMKHILEIAGPKKVRLMGAVIFNVLKGFCAGGTYITLLFAITCLMNGSFEFTKFLIYCFILAFLFLLRYVFEYAVNGLQSSLGFEMMCELRIKETDRLKYLSLGDFQEKGAGRLTSIFTSDMSFVEMYCISTLSSFIAGISILLCTTMVMMIVNFYLTMCAIVGFIPAYFVYRDSRKKFVCYGRTRQAKSQNCIGSVLEYLNGMETIRSYRITDKIFSKVDRELKEYKEAASNYELKTQLPMMWFQLLVRLGMALIFVCGLLFYFSGMTTLPVFLFFAIISASYYQPVESLLLDFGTLNLMDICLDHIQELHNKEPLSEGENTSPDTFGLSVDQVSFAYSSAGNIALKDVTALFPECSFSAIVGPSGGGKTTLLLLLARFWDVNKGQVKIDEKDVKSMLYADLLRNISFVFQDVYLFSGTIEDNIRMGRTDASREEIVSAAKAACCHDFIMVKPEGYATLIGSGGSSLSGGEKQRISIARAILKNAPIILMDEALSSIDAENALAIQKGLDVLTKGKTVVMIAHTLSSIRFVDQIIVMKDGCIVDRGYHDELLKREGVYKELWNKEHGMKRWKLHV